MNAENIISGLNMTDFQLFMTVLGAIFLLSGFLNLFWQIFSASTLTLVGIILLNFAWNWFAWVYLIIFIILWLIAILFGFIITASESQKVLGNKVNKVNQHSAISAYTQYGDDDKLRTIAAMIGERKYQTAFGTLLYSQSEAFHHSEKSSPDSLQVAPMREKLQTLNKIFRKFF